MRARGAQGASCATFVQTTSSTFRENSAKKLQMLQNLQTFAKFQKNQLDNLVDFEKCCKTHIYLQKSVPIQPKTSNILPKFCQKLATTRAVRGEGFAAKTAAGTYGPAKSSARSASAAGPGQLLLKNTSPNQGGIIFSA